MWSKAILINSIIETARKIVDENPWDDPIDYGAVSLELEELLDEWDELYEQSKLNSAN